MAVECYDDERATLDDFVVGLFSMYYRMVIYCIASWPNTVARQFMSFHGLVCLLQGQDTESSIVQRIFSRSLARVSDTRDSK